MNIFKPPGAAEPVAAQTTQDVAAECARWLKETFAPARGNGPERRKFVTDVGIAVDPLYTPGASRPHRLRLSARSRLSRRISVHPRRPAGHEPHRSVRGLGLFRLRRRRGLQPALPQADRDRHRADPGRARSADPVRLRFRPRDGRPPRSAMSASRSIRSPTWSCCSTASRPTASSASARSAIRSARSCSRSMPRSARSRASPGAATPSTCRTIRSRNTSRAARRSCRRRRPPSSPPTRSPGASTHAPNWSPMTVCVNHINAGGAGSSMGTAIALANARHYIELLLAQGLLDRPGGAAPAHVPGRAARLLRLDRQPAGAAPHLGAHDEGELRRHHAGGDGLPHHRLRPRPGGAGGAAQQHRAHRLRHARLCAGRRQLRLSRRLRRGGVDAEREFRARRAAHAADHRQRARLRRHHRSARRLLLCRDADRAGRAADPRRHGAGRDGSAARSPSSAAASAAA